MPSCREKSEFAGRLENYLLIGLLGAVEPESFELSEGGAIGADVLEFELGAVSDGGAIGAGAGAGAGVTAGAGVGGGVSSFLVHAVTAIASNEATSRDFFMVPSFFRWSGGSRRRELRYL